jgi:putative transcriptional regulator
MTDELSEKIAGEISMSAEPGKIVRKWREEFGLSQQQLADRMGVSNSVISDYESGRRKSPGVAVVKKMVESFIALDRINGSPVATRYMPGMRNECILAMEEFDSGVDPEVIISVVSGKNLNTDRTPSKKIYGYTIVDSLKAIVNLSSEDYLKIYGWNIERALIFTNVHYGRSPMVAIRAHPLTPAMVVYQSPENTDLLAIKLAKLEKIPLVVTELSVEELVKRLNKLKEGK